MIELSLKEIAYVVGAADPEGLPDISFNSITTDTRAAKRGELFVALSGGRFDGHYFARRAANIGCPAVIISQRVDNLPPGVVALMVDDTRAALGRIARYVRDLIDPRVIAVTGSNGKTTTKEMIFHVLRVHRQTVGAPMSYNNEIGLPKTLLDITSKTEAVVLEVGTNHAGEIARLAQIARPNVAVVTGVAATHLAGLGSEAGVAREKSALIAAVAPDGLSVVNLDCRHAHVMLHAARSTVTTFALDAEADLQAKAVRQTACTLVFKVDGVLFEVPMIGLHNVYNALAAVAACRGMGIGTEDCSERLRTFSGPPLRLQVVEHGDRIMLNDCYNANPASTSAALKTLVGMEQELPKMAILGDMLELGEAAAGYHAMIGRTLVKLGVDLLWAVGPLAHQTAAEAARQGMAADKIRCFVNSVDCSKQVCSLPHAAVMLVKGSRGVGMEKIVEAIAALPSGAEQGAAATAGGATSDGPN